MPMTATPSTLGEAFEQSYRRFAERPLLSWRGTTVTYGNVDLAARRLAAAYRRMGVVHGDRILCQLPNRAEILVSAAAAWKLGAIHVGADKDLTAVEVRSLLRWLRPTVAVVSGRMAGELSPPDTADPDRAGPMVVVCEGGTALGRARPWSELLEGTEELEAPSPLSPDDPAVILLTSGTTGRPKGVIRRQGQLLSHWTTTATFLEASPADRHLAQLPLSHGFGFGLAVAAVLTGGHLYLVDRFVAEEIFELVTAERITILNGTATHFDRLLKGFDPSLHDVSSLRAGAGSATRFPVTVLSGIFNQLGMRFVHTYGCSEGLGWKTVDREEILRGSAGSPPADHIRIVGPDGQPLPPGQVGEILVRKTHPVDYWGQPEATGGGDADWHSMGDLGLIGEDGLLFISGRVGHQVIGEGSG